jgi:hypothetical protein
MHFLIVIAPVVLLIVLGYVLRRSGVIPEPWEHSLSSFVYRISLPALIVASFWGVPWEAPHIGQLVWGGLVALAAFALLAGVLLALTPMNRRTKASVFLAAMVGNSVYMGFPIAAAMFGEEAGAAVVTLGTLFIVAGILIAIAGIDLFWEPEGVRAYVRKLLFNPLSFSVVAGVVLGFLPITTGNPLFTAVQALGATASPIALIALGAFLHGRFSREAVWHATLATALKLALAPIVAFLGIALFGVKFSELGVATVLAAMPVAVTTFSVAEELDLEVSVVASAIVVSTMASLITVPLVLAIWV